MSLSAAGRCCEVVAEAAWSWLFPARCVGCGAFETFLCGRCRETLEPVGASCCPRCGHPGVTWGTPGWCAECVGRQIHYVSARSSFLYEGVARQLVLELKSHGQRALAPLMVELAEADFRGLMLSSAADIVTWVPAHGSAERARGYNQAEVFARRLARDIGGARALPLVRKVSRTRHQRALTREGRQQNLRGAFAPLADGGGVGLAGANGVVLVDDVYTTGATTNEVAAVVAQSTGLPVHVFTFCRTVGAHREAGD